MWWYSSTLSLRKGLCTRQSYDCLHISNTLCPFSVYMFSSNALPSHTPHIFYHSMCMCCYLASPTLAWCYPSLLLLYGVYVVCCLSLPSCEHWIAFLDLC